MSKVSLKMDLISDDERLNMSISGIKIDNKIIYKENNISVTLIILNNKIKMKRVCKEYSINLEFEKNKNCNSTYIAFDVPKTLFLKTKTNKLVITDNKIEIDYELEGNNFSYSLEIGGIYDN